jgi:hypothetical protein
MSIARRVPYGPPWDIGKSAVCAPPFLRSPSPNCDQTKNQLQHARSRCVQVHCSCHAVSLMDARASCIAGSRHRRCGRLVPVVCGSEAGRRPAHGSRSNVVMFDVVDSRQQSGQGNIDANGPRADMRSYGSDGGADWRLRASRPRFVSGPPFAASVPAVPGRALAVTFTNISMRRRTAGGK